MDWSDRNNILDRFFLDEIEYLFTSLSVMIFTYNMVSLYGLLLEERLQCDCLHSVTLVMSGKCLQKLLDNRAPRICLPSTASVPVKSYSADPTTLKSFLFSVSVGRGHGRERGLVEANNGAAQV